MTIHVQRLASIQPRTSPPKFGLSPACLGPPTWVEQTALVLGRVVPGPDLGEGEVGGLRAALVAGVLSRNLGRLRSVRDAVRNAVRNLSGIYWAELLLNLKFLNEYPSVAKARKSCRSRQELSNEYFLAKFGVDRAENAPPKVCSFG